MCLFYFFKILRKLTYLLMTLTNQDINDIIILSIHIMIEIVIERVSATAYSKQNLNTLSCFPNNGFLR
jgi:hypothetical protein